MPDRNKKNAGRKTKMRRLKHRALTLAIRTQRRKASKKG